MAIIWHLPAYTKTILLKLSSIMSTSKLMPKSTATALFGAHLGRLSNLSVVETVGSTPSLFSLKRFREKRWSYLGVINEQCISGTALVHLGYACNVFTFVFDRQEKQLVETGFVLPPTDALHFDRDPDDGNCTLQHKRNQISMLHRCSEGKRLLDIHVGENSKRVIRAELEIEENLHSKPLQLITPMKNGKTVFTQKIAGLKASGSISTANKTFTFDKENSFAIFDWTNGFHNRITEWNWASAGGISECGKRIGLNFSSGVYTSGYGENVIWVDGNPELQEEIMFEYDSKNPLNPWLISNKSKTVYLTFTPENKRQSRDNFGIIASRFMQPVGSFSGYLTSQTGTKITVSKLGGVVEEHYAKW